MHLVSTQSRFISGPWSISSTVTEFRVGLSAGGKPTGGQNSGPIGSRVHSIHGLLKVWSWLPNLSLGLLSYVNSLLSTASGHGLSSFIWHSWVFTFWTLTLMDALIFKQAQSCSTEYSLWTTSLTVVPTLVNYGLYYLRGQRHAPYSQLVLLAKYSLSLYFPINFNQYWNQ